MGLYSIQKYYSELEKIVQFGGSKKETAIRTAFFNLLSDYAESKELMLVAEISIKNPKGKIITPDGTLKDNIRNDWGYWESKDESDDIDQEIRKKLDKGYPSDNIIFEDSKVAILLQHGQETLRVDMTVAEKLDEILTKFIEYERPEVHDFRQAIEHFKQDIPNVTSAIREIIESEQKVNENLLNSLEEFLVMAKVAINPDVTPDDVKEMMVQHILSADIFNTIFDEAHFHQENNIARQLNIVIDTFFTGAVRRSTLSRIKHYYEAINARAASIADHHEKQKFLKVVYENFYKAYNPKAADRLGIVYTPAEVVQFMIRNSDFLLHKHFGRTLSDKKVEILDPATGTGTYICDIIDYLPKSKLSYKYKNELHANEIAILPYYISNLNIEYTYKQKMGSYEEFDNLCFVDTLDNTGFNWVGKQGDLFGVSAENASRIRRQNERRISVIIGNPPYNARQENYNYQNSNRQYKQIDARIKETYVKEGTAQSQIVLYDMYVRFFRWATDRIENEGMIAFITNNSFIDGKAFDGFRKIAAQQFSDIYIINLKGNARTSGERRRKEGGNVFSDDIRVGVAIYFFIKRKTIERCRISYTEVNDYLKSEQKKKYLVENDISTLAFDNITPDKKYNWINQSFNDWDNLLPLIDPEVKAGISNRAIFKTYSRGISTQRDEWVYDFSKEILIDKMTYFISEYETTRKNPKNPEKFSIKWDRELETYLKRNVEKIFSEESIVESLYRPFIKKYLYFDKHLNGMVYQWPKFFSKKKPNLFIGFSGLSSSKSFQVVGSDSIICLDALEKTQCIPYFQNVDNDSNLENVSDFALETFRKHYTSEEITKRQIFDYTYAVLHNPLYIARFELNLKREFPRIPFYSNFKLWQQWGEKLLDIHINFNRASPIKLRRLDVRNSQNPQVKLKAFPDRNMILLDENTELHDVPEEAWQYKLGNKSAIGWVLDQYKPKTYSAATNAKMFDKHFFPDFKEKLIILIGQVCGVSKETVGITMQMTATGESA